MYIILYIYTYNVILCRIRTHNDRFCTFHNAHEMTNNNIITYHHSYPRGIILWFWYSNNMYVEIRRSMITIKGPVSPDGHGNDDDNDPVDCYPEGYRDWETHTYIRIYIYHACLYLVSTQSTESALCRVRALHMDIWITCVGTYLSEHNCTQSVASDSKFLIPANARRWDPVRSTGG